MFFIFTIALHPAIIIAEKLKAWPTIKRAIELTRSNKAYLMGVIIVSSILSLVIVLIALSPVYLGNAFLDDTGDVGMIRFTLWAAYNMLSRVIAVSLLAAITLIAYVEIRHREDGSFTLKDFRRDIDLA